MKILINVRNKVKLIEVKTEKVAQSKLASVDWDNIGFGRFVTDHMYICEYKNGAWQDGKIVPYGPLSLEPSFLGIHYGQSIFEGMKAFRMNDGKVNLFRPYKHHERLNKSMERMCMPYVPLDMFISGLHALLSLDREWVPSKDGASLYIRPYAFATDTQIGMKISESYYFIIFCGPVDPFYSNPLKVKVEENFVRAAEGGTGYAKCAGNYGASFYPTYLAKKEGYDQIIWTDAKEHKYIEEFGTMNAMFVIDNKIVTPPLTNTILDGITRDSILAIAPDLGYEIDLHRITVDELKTAFENNTISEAFGAGTAAVIAPISSITIEGKEYFLAAKDENSFMTKALDKLTKIKYGFEEDKYSWNYIID